MTTVLDRISSSNSAALEVTAEELLLDETWLRLALEHIDQRTTAYRHASAMIRNTPDCPLRILVDFHMIRTYIELESAHEQEALFSRCFFEISTLKYSIPSGAFRELMAYLTLRLGVPGQPPTRNERAYPFTTVLKIFGFSENDYENADKLREVERDTDERLVRVSRLLRVLTSDRFGGVCDNFDSPVKIAALEYIRNESRPAVHGYLVEHEERDLKDDADAENIAVSLGSFSMDTKRPISDGPRNEHFLLLSATSVVMRAARAMYLDRYSNGYWFAIRPMALLILDALGIGAPHSRRSAANQLRSWRDNAELLLNQLSEQLSRVTSSKRDPRRALKQLVPKVQGLARQAVSEEKLLRIEHVREPILLVRAAHMRQQGASAGGGHWRYFSYLQILDHLRLAVSEMAGLQYLVEECKSLAPERFQVFGIHEYGNEKRSELIRVRTYASNKQLRLWSAQWYGDNDETRLIEALNSAPWPGMRMWSEEAIRCDFAERFVTLPRNNSAIWHEGVVVTNSMGTFGIAPIEVEELGGGELLNLSALHKLIVDRADRAALEVGYKQSEAKFRRLPLEEAAIQEIRVNTRYCDIVFDIEPPEGEYAPRITLLSTGPVSELVAHFYDWLGKRLAGRTALSNAIRKIIGQHFESDEDGVDGDSV